METAKLAELGQAGHDHLDMLWDLLGCVCLFFLL
jgi:hypothetical protein